MNKVAKAVVLMAVATMSLTGCGIGKSIYSEIPLVPALSEKEVVDYYKNSLDYNAVVSRNINIKQVNYETKEVEQSVKNKLNSAQIQIEQELYSNNHSNSFVISKYQHGYIKSIIDDKILRKDSVLKQAEALDYYFVDVKYTLSPKAPGAFGENAKYLGIHGAYQMDLNGNSYLDRNFLNTTNEAVANYIKQTGEKPKLKVESTQVNTDGTTEVTGANLNGRAPVIDIDLYNKAGGGSLTQTAFMPSLASVFTPSAEEGTLSGYGIHPQGIAGLSKFGYSRNNLKGNMVLRYVFKSNVTNTSEIQFVTVYPVEMQLDNKLEQNGALIPQFAEDEMRKTIERSDRAINNNDIAALMSGKIYNDIGVAVLNGFYQNNTYLMRKLSNLNKVLARSNEYYLLEVESIVQEGPRGTQSYGTYKDMYYMVIKQVNTDFIIDDVVCISREMIKEPQIELDSSITKRLVALGLRGEVSEENKQAINELLNNLYTASNNRTLKDMYDCFETDTNLLSSSRKEYLNAQLRQWLTKYGAHNKSVYSGVITEWIGGAGEQAELITEEIIEYDGQDKAQYMQIYYLVSSISDKWAIEDIKVLEIKDISGDELQQVKQRIDK